MRAIKFLTSSVLLVALIGLATGVVELFEEAPQGGARFAPHVSRPAVSWYASKTRAVLASTLH